MVDLMNVTSVNRLSLDELGYHISTRGLAGAELELEEFAWRLIRAGIAPNLTAVLLDRNAPAVVRERAFARAAVAARTAPIAHVRAA
jgi:hypothetical protein